MSVSNDRAGTTDRWRRLEALYHEMLARPPDERAAALRAACPDDPALAAEVQSLVDHPDSAGGLLAARAHEVAAGLLSTSSSPDSDRERAPAPESASLVGRTLSHYKVLGELSRGGMGVVYRARDLKLDREVAFKVLLPEVVSDPERRRRFEREARAAGGLSHSNIGVIHEVDEVEGVVFIAMELIAGEPLDRLIARGPLSVSRALELGVQVADGLSRAHEKGIVHRDLKPGNVMVSEDGHAKIIDFGLAELLESSGDALSELETARGQMTKAGAVMGTAAYMSPEQARGLRVDARSDVFSFAVLLHELLTGRRPFTGPSRLDVLQAIVGAEAPRLGRGDATAELQRIVDKCLAKDPSDRYQAIRDVAVDLRSELRRLESGAASAPPTAVAGRVRRPRPSPLAIVAGVLVLVTAAVWMRLDRTGAQVAERSLGSIESIVALPATVNGGKDDDFLADAIPNTLSASLGQIQGLTTRAPPSSADLERVGGDLDKVARAYSVGGILRSTVSVREARLSVNLQLVDARTRDLRWSRDYEGARDDFVNLLYGAATELNRELRPGTTSLLARPASGSAAELVYQRGLYYSNRFSSHMTPEDIAPALASFEEALRLDPRRADAAAQIATLQARRTSNGLAPSEETRLEVDIWAHRAIEIDSRSGEAWAALAASERDADRPSYRKMLEFAVRGGRYPGAGETMLASILNLSCYRLALVLHQKAGRENPLYSWPFTWAGLSLMVLNRSHEGLEVVEEASALDERAVGLRVARSALLIDLGRFDEAGAAIEGVMGPASLPLRQFLGHQLAWRRGEVPPFPAALKTVFRDRRMNAATRWLYLGTPFAATLARHGAPDAALDLLGTVSQSGWGAPAYDWLALNPDFDPVRADPRFRKLLAQARVPFDEMLRALDAARGRGELPEPLTKPLETLRTELGLEPR